MYKRQDVALLERLEFFRRQLGLFAVLFHGAEQGRAARGGGRYEKIPQLTLRRDPWNMERVKGIAGGVAPSGSSVLPRCI